MNLKLSERTVQFKPTFLTVNKLLLLFYLFNKNVSKDAYDVGFALIYLEKIILILSITNIIKVVTMHS